MVIETVALAIASILAVTVAYAIVRTLNPPKCREVTLYDFKESEIVEHVFSNPTLRKEVLKRLEAESKDVIHKTIITALQQALELPNQTFIFIVLALGGAGAGRIPSYIDIRLRAKVGGLL
jgi:hypothetical protein